MSLARNSNREYPISCKRLSFLLGGTYVHCHCLFGVSIGLHRCHTSLARLVVLEALVRGFLDSCLTGDDLLDGGEDAAPVLEDGEGHALTCAVGDEIW